MSFEKVPNFLGKLFIAEMTVDEHRFFRFNSFLLDTEERQLLQGDAVISLTPKAFDTLVYLVRKSGRLVTKDELMNAVWPDSFVDEGNIPRTIHTLRKTLGEDNTGNKFIETVPTKGYRFVSAVEKVVDVPAVQSEETSVGDAGAEPARIESPPANLNEPRAETGRRRNFLVLAAGVVVIALATGFWMSNGTMLPRPLSAGLSRHSMNGEAYRHFQQGRLLVADRTADNYKQALEHFEKAIEIDPYYADAYAGKADAKTFQLGKITHDDIATARVAVEKALELDRNSSYALTIKCRISGTYDWEFDRAVTECQRAVELGPDDSDAHRELGFALHVVGRLDEAVAEMKTAVALSPTSFNKRSHAMMLYMSRRYDDAIDEMEQVEATDPNSTDSERWLMSSFVLKNDHAKAFEHLVKLQEAYDVQPGDLDAIKAAFASGGWPAALRAALNSSSGIGDKKTMLTAGLFAQIGEKDKAFEILDDMHKRRAIMMVSVPSEPLLDPLRDDDRYAAILSKMNLK